MRRVFAGAVASLLILPLGVPGASAASVGGKCSVLGKKVWSGAQTLVCKKNSRGVKVWIKSPSNTTVANPGPQGSPINELLGARCADKAPDVKLDDGTELVCFPSSNGPTVWTKKQDAIETAARPENVRSNAACVSVGAVASDSSQKKFVCSRGPEGYVTWVAAGSVTTVTTPIKAGSSLLMTTVPNEQKYRNGAFGMRPMGNWDLAQSLTLERDVRLQRVALTPTLISVALDPRALTDAYEPDWLKVYHDSSYSTEAVVTVSVWRRDDESESGENLDLRDGFTKVHTEKTSSKLAVQVEFDLDFAYPVALRAGRYVLTFSFKFADPLISEVRFQGQQSGDNQRAGVNDNKDPVCDYTPSIDIYPQGRAYRATPDTEIRFLDGSTALFTRHRSKVGVCTDIPWSEAVRDSAVWNQGDIAIDLYGLFDSAVKKPASNQPWSENNLSPPAGVNYQGLSCNPLDPRISKIALPNGVGPEARAAASCQWLEWLSNSKRNAPPIKVATSPAVPDRVKEEMVNSILAGDRLFGRYAKRLSAYEYLFSVDEDWMCEQGASLVEPRVIGQSARYEQKYNRGATWATTRNSGCVGSPYSFASSEPKNLGADMEVFFSWSLIRKADNRPGLLDDYADWLWWVRMTNHEFVHSIQIQRVGADGVDRWGSWFGEGQATYLAYSAASMGSGPSNMRQFALNELARDIAAAGLSRVKVQDLESEPSKSRALFYSAGYFAYEYLVAHFGVEKVWGLWDAWAAPSTSSEQCPCADSRAAQHFGVNADTLLNQINDYINAQLTARQP